MVAARAFASRRDVPDVLGFEDYATDGDGTVALVAQRFADDAMFLDSQSFPLPKQPGGVRGLTVINPIDDFILRAYVGRCSMAIVAATYTDRVLNGVIRRPGAGWISADFSKQYRRKRELQARLYGDEHTQAVGFFDVKNFFKSCRHDSLVEALGVAGAPEGAVRQLGRLMDLLFPSGVGLPIGFEGSGPLANLLLDPVDRALLSLGLEFVRWTDDLDVFLTSSEQWPIVLELVRRHLRQVGLCLNFSKVAVLDKGPAAEQRLLDPGRDSIMAGDSVENAKARLGIDLMSRAWFDHDELSPAHFRSCLGVLRGDRSPEGLGYLEAAPHWIDQEPRSVGDYLVVLSAELTTRKTIDQDWMLDRAIGRQPARDSVAGQLHMCRALAKLTPSKTAGDQLLDFAYDPKVQREYPSLGAWAVRAWSASHAWKPAACMDLVRSVGHVSYRRAAIAGFAGRSSAADKCRLAAVARDKPDIGPVIRWVAHT